MSEIIYPEQEEKFIMRYQTECPQCGAIYDAQVVDGDKRALQLALEQAEARILELAKEHDAEEHYPPGYVHGMLVRMEPAPPNWKRRWRS